ncbi:MULTISPECIES: DUF1488 domain-containing protein [Buttiauxella]|uniref:DUF1488 domain-containing protein n=1 Tax=Buttiauxella ferragutiae ATCC 51602 TaxID=1354252 RepID=A0ABX2WBU4_9ENTR|nr:MULTISPECIES: DUF1488 domain-containing protein [Buttiauxella]OAT29572.1 hypothetical protein M976_01302 [Buttiauxella ferragutiae ATCC 51602]TDN52574.1 uncharacterized protein DUF1488 [Buttiauxella sp. JUb87]
MNQAIQFPDREQWDDQLQAICFPALVNGFQVMCGITGEIIASRYGGDNKESWLELFRQNRWDLEDEAEELIAAGEEDNQGCVWLS